MRKELLKTLPVEFQMLHSLSKKGKLDHDLTCTLKNKINNIKVNHIYKRDKLQYKLHDYGNKGRWGQELLKKLSKAIYESKGVPNESVGKWLSVEIECVFISQKRVDEFALYCRKQGYSKLVTVKNDGSIQAQNDDDRCGNCNNCENDERCNNTESDCVGKEIIVSFTLENSSVLQNVCQKLIDLDCFVNKSCGLHVHFDCRRLVARQVTTIGKRVANCVPALKQMLPKSRQNNHYCQEIINKHGNGRRSTRYAFVNLQSFGKHQTLEIRGHSGTIDYIKIINWIRVLKVIMEKRNTASFSTVQDMVNNFAFGDYLKAYILERATKFTKTVQGDDVAQDSEGLLQSSEIVAATNIVVTNESNQLAFTSVA